VSHSNDADPSATELAVEIVRFVDDHFPGFVECVLRDASGCAHTFVEKVPVISLEVLDSASHYPRPGTFACVVGEAWTDAHGRSLVRVRTDEPWGIESTTGQSSFVVLTSQISAVSGDRDPAP
jgi:hypothetical protein